uniref:MADF domain-containing protein n=1 Tax=Steinernema glaseri TaxID=37863 RepID=A0A1I8A3Z4_9BILA
MNCPYVVRAPLCALSRGFLRVRNALSAVSCALSTEEASINQQQQPGARARSLTHSTSTTPYDVDAKMAFHQSGGAPAGSTTSLAALHGDDAVLKLIEVVKAEVVLWNYTEVPRDAESVRQLADAWDRVTAIMSAIYPKANRTVLRTTWKSLRHRHRRRGFSNTGNYKWKDHMAFLNDVVEPLDESASPPRSAGPKKRRSNAAVNAEEFDSEIDDSELPFTFSTSSGSGQRPPKVGRSTTDDYYDTILRESSSPAQFQEDNSKKQQLNGDISSAFTPMQLLVAKVKVEAEDSASDTSASANVAEADIPNTENDENNLLGSMELTALASRWNHDENVGVDDPISITELDHDYEPRHVRVPVKKARKAGTSRGLNQIASDLKDLLSKSNQTSMVAQIASSIQQKPSFAFGDLIRDRMAPLDNGPTRWRAEGLILTAVEKIVADLSKETSTISN